MSETKFTPGPWFVSQSPVQVNKLKIPFRSIKNKGTIGGRIIANTYAGNGYTLTEKQKEELETNARLIAAAPSMYELLKGLVNRGEIMSDTTEIKKLLNSISHD